MADLQSTLTDIYRRRGELTDQVVVDEARPETAPLHDRFEWDDEVAGEAYRRVQARELIRSVQITFGPAQEKTRGFVSVRQQPNRRGYAPVEEVAADPFASKLLLLECEREIADLKRKYGHLREFVELMRQAIA